MRKTIERQVIDRAMEIVGIPKSDSVYRTVFNDRRKNGRRIKYSFVKTTKKQRDMLKDIVELALPGTSVVVTQTDSSEYNNWLPGFYWGMAVTVTKN